MHDRHQESGGSGGHVHEGGLEKGAQGLPEKAKLRKMVEYWVSHNQEHARSYRLWAGRAREAGCEEPAGILEDIASETALQNERLMKIIEIIDSSEQPD